MTANTRLRRKINSNWEFNKGERVKPQSQKVRADSWRKVNLPHDWSREGPFDRSNCISRYYVGDHLEYQADACLPKGVGWYRRHLTLKKDFANKQIYLEFEGVFRDSIIWINGRKVGNHPWGYTGFFYNITPFLHFGPEPNIITVKVNARKCEGWWHDGSGIYRNVWLIATSALHIENWGTFVTTPRITKSSAKINIRTKIRNSSPAEEEGILETDIIDTKNKIVAKTTSAILVSADSTIEVPQNAEIKNPRLWSPDSPYLYQVRSRIIVKGTVIDVYATPFGVRWFEFTPDRGFFLNGKRIQIRGMNIHHDFGGLGTALPEEANFQTVQLMKEMGCNMLRSAHNAAAPSLMEACDRLGMLFWAETRYLPLDPPKKTIPPLRELIQRDRNHPSVICWSLANTAGTPDGILTGYLQELNKVAKEEDAARPTAVALEANADANANGFAFVADIVGYNGGGMWGKDDRDHKTYPERKIIISEYSAGRGARGIYEEIRFNKETVEKNGAGRIVKQSGQYCSIYDLCRAHEKEWRHIAERPWLAGGMMWSGIEYLGETTGWPMVTSQFGVFDICRFPKDTYYFYLQEWTAKPMVHVFPHWTWPGKEGRLIDVWCYSNCDKVELFLNGKSLGIKNRRPLTHLNWEIPYQPGVLSAQGIVHDKIVCQKKIKTAGPACKIKLLGDRKAVGENRIAFITVRINDKKGILVPAADNAITVKAERKASILGLCSGNPASHEAPTSGKMPAFNGLLLAIIQIHELKSRVQITAASPGLASDTIVIGS